MRTVSRTRGDVGWAAFGIGILIVLEFLSLGMAPSRDRPVIIGVLAGAAAAGFVVVVAMLGTRRAATGRPAPPLPRAGGGLASSAVVEGFPMDAVRPLLLSPDAPSLNRLYLAWVLAGSGYGAEWIGRYPDLPASAARLLADAAACQQS